MRRTRIQFIENLEKVAKKSSVIPEPNSILLTAVLHHSITAAPKLDCLLGMDALKTRKRSLLEFDLEVFQV